jgi:hypothetical protein
MERIHRNSLSWQFSARVFDLQRKWVAEWNVSDVLAPPKSQSLFLSELKASFTEYLGGCSAEKEEEDTKDVILLQDDECFIRTATAIQPASQAADTDPILLKRLETDGFVELSFSSSQSLKTNKQTNAAASEASLAPTDRHPDVDVSTEPSKPGRPHSRMTRSVKRQLESEVLDDTELDEDVKMIPRKRKIGRRYSALAGSSVNASVEGGDSHSPR